MNRDNPAAGHGIRNRLTRELRAYLFISAYLWICFAALTLFENSLLQVNQIALTPMYTAVVKALILAKFILIGKALKIGESDATHILLHRMLWKSLSMLVLLLALAVIEDLVVGLVHGHSLAQAADEILNRPWLQKCVRGVVILLVIIPMIAFEEIDKALGEGRLMQMLLNPARPE